MNTTKVLHIQSIDQEDFKQIIKELFKEEFSDVRNLLSEKGVITPLNGMDNLFTKKDAAAYLSISLPTITKYTKEGDIKSVRIGRRIKYRKSELERYLQR